METTLPILSLSVAAAASAAAAFPKIKARLELSRAKHRSLAGHSKMSRRGGEVVSFFRIAGGKKFWWRRTLQDVAAGGEAASVLRIRGRQIFRLRRRT